MSTTVFPLQQWLIKTLPGVEAIAKSHGLAVKDWEDLTQHARDFQVRVPLLGSFSAGKTSLINTILGESLFSVNITPETAVAAEISAGESEELYGLRGDGQRVPVTRDDLQANRLHTEGARVRIIYKCDKEVCKRWPHLLLVDLPGWASGDIHHWEVIDRYAQESLAYLLIVSCEDGTLVESSRRILAGLQVWDIPYILVLSKVDKRLPSDVSTVAAAVAEESATVAKRAPMMVAQVSSRKKEVSSLIQALDQLESRAEERFAAGVGRKALLSMEQLAGHVELVTRAEFADGEKIAAESAQLQEEVRRFEQELSRQQQALVGQVSPFLQRVQQRVQQALNSQLESLLRKAESGGNVQETMLLTIRGILSDSVKTDFEPTVARHVQSLESYIPESLVSGIRIPDFENNSSGKGSGDWADSAMTWGGMLTTFLTTVSWGGRFIPYVGPILTVVGLAFSLFGGKSEKENAELREGRRREAIRKQLIEAISAAVDALSENLRPALEDRIHKMIDQLTSGVEQERQKRLVILQQLEDARREGEEAVAQQREQASQDLQALRSWMEALQNQIIQIQEGA